MWLRLACPRCDKQFDFVPGDWKISAACPACGMQWSTWSDIFDKAPDASGPGRNSVVRMLLEGISDWRVLVYRLLMLQARMVSGTEAVAWLVGDGQGQEPGLVPVAHVRPEKPNDEVRDRVMVEFEKIARKCISEGTDGFIDLKKYPDGTSLYCLATIIHGDDKPVALTAVICKCRGSAEAKVLLERLALAAGYSEFYALWRRTKGAGNRPCGA